jgi:hypothetical protein
MGTMTAEGRDAARLGPALFNGVDKDSTAYKLLASMGWREGEGLVRDWTTGQDSRVCMGPASLSVLQLDLLPLCCIIAM